MNFRSKRGKTTMATTIHQEQLFLNIEINRACEEISELTAEWNESSHEDRCSISQEIHSLRIYVLNCRQTIGELNF
jgi:hypothetical protein